ncbi:MAG: 2-phosphosulfolactate phosphatase [Alphaproteobacteria bacterium]|nr:2-phosphosulfolactate phosphatase [Alphaproteobacteria bacterium]
MSIRIESLLEGARRASGTVVIIDVFRAFTTAAVALARSADRIVMVAEVADALELRRRGQGQICMGEVGGLAPPGFDFGNSPHELSTAEVRGKTIIQRTGAGTQGIVAAAGAMRLYAGALVTASATARAVRHGSPPEVSLVAMGNRAIARTDEDELCAMHLRNLLEGRPGDPQAVRRVILAGGEAPTFGDPTGPHRRRADLDMALDIDRYDFAIRVTLEEGRPIGRMERAS